MNAFALFRSYLSQTKNLTTSSSTKRLVFSQTLPSLVLLFIFFSLIPFPEAMSSEQILFYAVTNFSYGTAAFDCGTRTAVFVNLSAESDGAPTFVCTAKLSGANVTDSSAFWRMVHGHERFITSTADFVAFWSVRAEDNFFFPSPIFISLSAVRKEKAHQ